MTASLEDQQEKFEKRREQLAAQKQQIINQNSFRNEKEDNRLKMLIGLGILEDLKNSIETDTYAYSGKIAALRAILNCTIHNKANRDFLKQYDYI